MKKPFQVIMKSHFCNIIVTLSLSPFGIMVGSRRINVPTKRDAKDYRNTPGDGCCGENEEAADGNSTNSTIDWDISVASSKMAIMNDNEDLGDYDVFSYRSHHHHHHRLDRHYHSPPPPQQQQQQQWYDNTDANSVQSLENDLESLRSVQDEERQWKRTISKTKLLATVLVVGAMLFTTIRVNDEQTRITSVSLPESQTPQSWATTTTTTTLATKNNNNINNYGTDMRVSHHHHHHPDFAGGGGMEFLRHLANLTEPLSTQDVPFLLHFPRSGGTTLKDILGLCLGVTLATDAVVVDPTHHLMTGVRHPIFVVVVVVVDWMPLSSLVVVVVVVSLSLFFWSLWCCLLQDTLRIVHSDNGAAVVNVDMGTIDGIHRAGRLGLIPSRLAQAIVSPRLYETAQLFHHHHHHQQQQQQARAFVMMRHPIHREVSRFHYASVARWEASGTETTTAAIVNHKKYDPDLAYVSLEMYARSKRVPNNSFVRLLVNKSNNNNNNDDAAVTVQDLETAKTILRTKFLVGLLERKGESYARLQEYLVATGAVQSQETTPRQRECRDRLLHWSWSNQHTHPQVEEGSTVWELLLKQNEFDMLLYQYAKDELFPQQTLLFQQEQNTQ